MCRIVCDLETSVVGWCSPDLGCCSAIYIYIYIYHVTHPVCVIFLGEHMRIYAMCLHEVINTLEHSGWLPVGEASSNRATGHSGPACCHHMID